MLVFFLVSEQVMGMIKRIKTRIIAACRLQASKWETESLLRGGGNEKVWNI